MVGVLNGFAREAEARSEGIGRTDWSGEAGRGLPCLFFTGEKGLDVTAGGSTLTGRGLDLEVDCRADDVDGRGWPRAESERDACLDNFL